MTGASWQAGAQTQTSKTNVAVSSIIFHFVAKEKLEIVMGRFNLNEEDFDEVRKKAENFYINIGEVSCPYIHESIPFNTKGLRHLKFKTNKQARPRSDQYARLKLLHLAPQILKESHTL